MRKPLNIDSVEETDLQKIPNPQSKITILVYIGEYKKFNSYSIVEENILLTKSFYVGFCILKLLKLKTYKRYYDKRLLCFAEDFVQLHFIEVIHLKTYLNHSKVYSMIQIVSVKLYILAN